MIHIISTSANIPDQKQLRNQQYMSGLSSIIQHYSISPYIIETVAKTEILAEHFLGHSNYSPNKGVNELINMDLFFKSFPHHFDDDDDIIKTTLRYEITSSYFIDCIKKNTHDIYCKFGNDIYPWSGTTGVHTFLISMKYRCWKEFLLNNFDRTVGKDDPIEFQIAKYASKKHTKYMDSLGITAIPAALNRTYNV